jgi:hypothetical protein
MSLWYVQCKPCTYLVSGLALSPYEPNRAPPDPHHLGVPSGASKMIYEPLVCFTQTEHKSCTDANTVSKQIKWDSTCPTSPRSFNGCFQYYFRAYVTFDANRTPILHQELHYLQMDRTELPLKPRHQGVPSSASKMISIPMVCSVQNVHLSCFDTNTISKRSKTRFHTTHVTYEFHQVRPKLFMSLWYV